MYRAVQIIYKNCLLVPKITWGIWKTTDKQWKVQNVEIWWAAFAQKIHSFSKNIIYLTLLSSACVKIHLITYAIFETISHFSRQNSTVFFSLKHYILSTKVVYQVDFALLGLNFSKFLISFCKQKVSFSSKFGSFFSVMRDNSSVLLLAETLYAIEKSSTSECKLSDLPLLTLKFTKFIKSFLEPRVSFSWNIGHSSVLQDKTFLYLFI